VRPPLRLTAFVFAIATMAPSAAHAQYRYPPLYPYPYPAYRYGYGEADLRVKVKPKDASVYVDGYFAGKVEDYDGAFERLHVEPGQHEIVVYLDGFRSLRQRLYLSPNRTRTIEGTLERLAPGDPPEPLPQPIVQPDRQDPGAGRPPIAGRRQPPPLPPPPPPPGDRGREQPAPQGNSRNGTIALRVQPSGATVFVDGERWEGPKNADERLIIQVSEGRHRVEVERDGYERFVTEIDVRRSDTAPLNVSLTRTR
jgi:PEGA domain-containing protein